LTPEELFKEGCKLLRGEVEDCEFDAMQLLLFCFGINKTNYLLNRSSAADEKKSDEFFSLISRRKSGEPLQYILENQVFLDNSFYVGEGVLIPRPETEELTALCINTVKLSGYKVIYDLCAGSGCIGISIALNCPGTRVFLFEKYDPALKYLRKNIPDSIKDRVFIIQADIFDFDFTGLPQPDVIASNPPYIPSNEIYSLQKEVKKEPVSALDGGTDGLDFYRCIISKWIPYINRGGFAAFECGEEQAEKIAQMFDPSLKTQILTDLYGVRRFITATFNK